MSIAIDTFPSNSKSRGLSDTAGDDLPLVERSDEELMLRYRNRDDRRAYDALVHRYERELFSYLRRYVGDATMAEDVFQATFLHVHTRREQFEEGRTFRPWLYAIATHAAIDAQRRNRRHRLVSLDQKSGSGEDDVQSLIHLLTTKEPGPTRNLVAEERRRWVQAAVEELPEGLRSALILVYYQGMKYSDAAGVLEIPVGTVKSRLHAAVLKLNQAWLNDHPNEEM